VASCLQVVLELRLLAHPSQRVSEWGELALSCWIHKDG
jgi:hypothetical protein